MDFIWHLIFGVRVGQELLELVAMVAWCMWFNRSKVRLGKPRQKGLAILQRARFLLYEFQMVNLKIHSGGLNEDAQWSPPKAPWYKLNVDGATFESSHSSGVGAVIRDFAGRVEVALSKNIPYPLGPLEIEAKALEEGVHFAWDVGV